MSWRKRENIRQVGRVNQKMTTLESTLSLVGSGFLRNIPLALVKEFRVCSKRSLVLQKCWRCQEAPREGKGLGEMEGRARNPTNQEYSRCGRPAFVSWDFKLSEVCYDKSFISPAKLQIPRSCGQFPVCFSLYPQHGARCLDMVDA